MPKQTFHNLAPPKKTHIIEAMQQVVLQRPIAKITLSDIVRAAGIPRGSVYQYFTGLEDIFSYLLDHSLEQWEDMAMAHLREKTYDFFEYFQASFHWDLAFFQHSPHQRILRKFFKESHPYALDIRAKLDRRKAFFHQVIERLDTTVLGETDPEDVYVLYDQLNHMKHYTIRKTIRHQATSKEAAKEYAFLIDLVKRGMERT